MKWVHVVLGGLFLSAQVGCGAGDDPSGVPESAEESSLAVGSEGARVLEAREYLTRFGYFPNAELQKANPNWQPMLPSTKGDAAHFDDGLESALKRYQINMGLEATGELDPATAAAMKELRCGNPDTDPTLSEAVDKWAHVGERWTKTTITYRIKEPNTTLPGMANAEATRAAVLAGMMIWVPYTHFSFVEVTTGEDVLFSYANLGPDVRANATTLPSPSITISNQFPFTATTLRMTSGHEVGHVLGLHHSSNFFANVTPRPLMAPTGNNVGIPETDDRIAANVMYNSWERLPGLAFDIGVGVNGHVWIIGQGARQPYRWNGSSWDLVSVGSPASRIDVDDLGRPWVVLSTGAIWTHNGLAWSEVPGNGRAVDVGIGRPGQIYVLGLDGLIYRFLNSVWTFVGGVAGSTSIDIDMSNIPHVIGPNTQMWACGGGCSLTGSGLDVGFGGPPGTTFGTENWGWAIAADDRILARNRQGAIPNADPRGAAPEVNSWVATNGTARRVSVGPQGRPWIVSASGNIYRRRELP